MKETELIEILENLLKFDDILACMVVKQGLEGIVPSNMKIKDIELWRLVHEATRGMFDIIEKFYDYGLDRLNLELGKYTILVAPVSRNFSLVVIIPSLANMGLLDIEIENTLREILELKETRG